MSNPALSEAERAALSIDLGSARRAVRSALRTGDGLAEARARVRAAKVCLGERGPVWWTDSVPDLNRHMAKNTVYADWFADLPEASNGSSPCPQGTGLSVAE